MTTLNFKCVHTKVVCTIDNDNNLILVVRLVDNFLVTNKDPNKYNQLVESIQKRWHFH